jgi:hypothetical protein
VNAELFERFSPVAGLSDENHVVFARKHSGDSLAQHRMIVYGQDSNRVAVIHDGSHRRAFGNGL